MLTPDGIGGTSLYMDDLAFFLTTAAPRAAGNTNDPDDPVETPVASQTPSPVPSVTPAPQTAGTQAAAEPTASKTAAPGSSVARSVARATSTPRRTAVAEVAGLRDATPVEASAPPDQLSQARKQGRRAKFVWLAAAIAAVISFSGAYLGSKRLR
jgi:hypothetical protein